MTIQIDLELKLRKKGQAKFFDYYTVESGENIGELLSHCPEADKAELVMSTRGVAGPRLTVMLCRFKRKGKSWLVDSPLPKLGRPSRVDIKKAREQFMASEQHPALDPEEFWTREDLVGYYRAAKGDSRTPEPRPGQGKTVDGMLEYLLSIGYIEV